MLRVGTVSIGTALAVAITAAAPLALAQSKIPIRGIIGNENENINITYLSATGKNYFMAVTTEKSRTNASGLARASLFLVSCNGKKINVDGVSAFDDSTPEYILKLATGFCRHMSKRRANSTQGGTIQ